MQAQSATRRKTIATAPTTPVRMAAPIVPELANLARLNIREVSALVGRCEQSVRDMVKAGKFPAADHRDGPRCVRWSAGSVRRWLESTRMASE